MCYTTDAATRWEYCDPIDTPSAAIKMRDENDFKGPIMQGEQLCVGGEKSILECLNKAPEQSGYAYGPYKGKPKNHIDDIGV